MVYPLNNNTDPYHDYKFYQGVIVSELICTLGLFFFLQTLHYCIWGHEEEVYLWKKNQQGETDLKPPQPSEWKWDQKGWNMYFAVIFGNHISAVFLPLTFRPDIPACVIAFSHFAMFIGIVVNSVFITEKKKGRGGKTTANRVFWFIMCLLNLALMVMGMIGISDVMKSASP